MEQDEQKSEHGPVLKIGTPAVAACVVLFIASLGALLAGGWLLSMSGHQMASSSRLENELLTCQLEQRDLQGRISTFQMLFIEARKPTLLKAVDEFERRTRNKEAALALRQWLDDPSGEPPAAVRQLGLGGPQP